MPGPNKTALIVEDEVFVALELERILTDAGFVIAGIAPDSATAYRLAPNSDFALVDVNLSDGETGPSIATQLHDVFGLNVVFVTANPGAIGENHAALGYVLKPFSDRAITAAARLAAGDRDADRAEIMPLPHQRG